MCKVPTCILTKHTFQFHTQNRTEEGYQPYRKHHPRPRKRTASPSRGAGPSSRFGGLINFDNFKTPFDNQLEKGISVYVGIFNFFGISYLIVGLMVLRRSKSIVVRFHRIDNF